MQGQILQARADIAAAEADAERARAMLDEARANRQDLQVIAPFAGTVATRTAEPGEVVTAGTPIVTLVNLAEVYLRAFVPEGQIGRVRLGQPARVYLDSDPTKPIDAQVIRVDPQASFTPENTYFREDRVKQVVGVKLAAARRGGLREAGHAGRRRDPRRGRGVAARSSAESGGMSAAGTSTEPAIQVRGLTKRYGATEAVRGIDLEVQAGRDLRADRPRRRGQDLDVPDPGRRDGGHRRAPPILLGRPARAAREHVGYLTQAFSLYRDLSVAGEPALRRRAAPRARRATSRGAARAT